MVSLEEDLKEALSRVNAHAQVPEFETVGPDLNVFDAVDSMAIVDLLLETESLLEERTGEYVPLADETIFDSTSSPLRRWSDWVAFVERRHAKVD